MLGKKILKRLTRLGLSTYLMMWCMSFTVCASDYPLSDMEMADKSAVIVESTQDDASVMPDEKIEDVAATVANDIVMTSEEDDVSDEDVLPEDDPAPADEDAAETDEEQDDDALPEEGPTEEDSEDAVDVIDPDDLQNINGTFEIEPAIETFGLNTSDFITFDRNLSFKVVYTPESYVFPEDAYIRWVVMDENLTAYTDNNTVKMKNMYGLENTVYITTYEPVVFYVGVVYRNATVYKEDFCKVEYIPYPTYVNSFTLDTHEIVITDKTKPIKIGVAEYSPIYSKLDEEYLSISILDSRLREMIYPDIIVNEDGTIDISGLDESEVFYIKYTYEDPELWYDPSLYVSDLCRVQYVAPEEEKDIIVEFPQTCINVELYKPENILPVNILADFDEPQLLTAGGTEKYYVAAACFENSSMNELFDIEVVDGDKLSIISSDSLLSVGNTTAIGKIVKSKYSSKLVLSLCGATGNRTVKTEDIITLNIKKSVPTVKAGKITFNPYMASLSKLGCGVFDPSFSGASVEGIELNPAKSSSTPVGFMISVNKIVVTAAYNLSVKSGKIPLLATLSGDEWRLPDGNRLPVDVPFTAKSNPFKAKVIGTNKATLNPAASSSIEYANFNFTITDMVNPDFYDIDYFIVDSKNNDAWNAFTQSKSTHVDENGNTIFSVTLWLRESTPGETYTVRAHPYCYNGMNGTEAKVTVKVINTKDVNKVGMSVALKGDINALDPDTDMIATITPKNIARFDQIYFSFTSKNGTDLSQYLHDASGFGNVRPIRQRVTETHPFWLIEDNYDGQKIKINITGFYTVSGETKSVSVVKEVTVKRNAVTPNFRVTKASINPDIESNHKIEFNLTGSRCLRYDLSCEVYDGKTKTDLSPYCYYDSDGGLISFDSYYVGMDKLKKYAGKTLDVKLTPVLPKDVTTRTIKELKTSTYKLTIIDNAKKPVASTATVKGSINSISDMSYVNISLKYKNVYDIDLPGILIDFYQQSGSTRINCNGYFNHWFERSGGINGTNIFIYRAYDENIPDGTYKVDIKTTNGSPLDVICTTTASFKVKKGSVSIVSSKGTTELYNNNTKRDTFILSPKNNLLNGVSNVTIADNSSAFEIYDLGNGKYAIGFKRNADGTKYVEVDKKNLPITKAVTKTVKLNVYNYGSDKPVTFSMKVKINP